MLFSCNYWCFLCFSMQFTLLDMNYKLSWDAASNFRCFLSLAEFFVFVFLFSHTMCFSDQQRCCQTEFGILSWVFLFLYAPPSPAATIAPNTASYSHRESLQFLHLITLQWLPSPILEAMQRYTYLLCIPRSLSEIPTRI